jgi:RimJ/RimL family protein N-acetyltransferase
VAGFTKIKDIKGETKMLKGKKVILRPVKRTDLQNFLIWFNDPEVTQYLSMYLPMTEMAEEKYIEDLPSRSNTDIRLVIESIEIDSNKAIGSIGLSNINNKDQNASFGIAIGENEYWSKGYGTEAARLIIKYGFEQLNLHRISSSAFSFNERSLRLHKKVGFREEGRMRECTYKNGSYCDEVIFGILKSEWLAQTNK